MKKRIYIYELDCYKVASKEQIQRMRISPERYFNLEGLPSEELAEKLEEFIWERGKMLAPSSMASEVTYYNNIREFLIDRKIQSLDAREEEKNHPYVKRMDAGTRICFIKQKISACI